MKTLFFVWTAREVGGLIFLGLFLLFELGIIISQWFKEVIAEHKTKKRNKK